MSGASLTPASRFTADQQALDARARAIRQWRRLDTSEVEGAMRRCDRTPADLVPQILGGLRLEERLMESQIAQIWPKVIDPIVARHTVPVGLAKGTLFVTVDSNVWLSEILRYRRRELLERIQNAFGSSRIEKISFRLG